MATAAAKLSSMSLDFTPAAERLRRKPPPHVGDHIRWITLADDHGQRIERVAWAILHAFDSYYVDSRAIPQRAKAAFEDCNPSESLYLSRRRLSAYSDSIRQLSSRLKSVFPGLAKEEPVWREIEAHYMPAIADRYESDIAAAYIHSVRRITYDDDSWRPVEYALGWHSPDLAGSMPHILRHYRGPLEIDADLVKDLIAIPAFSANFRSLDHDAEAASRRINALLAEKSVSSIMAIDMITAGFYRNRGAYIVGRITASDTRTLPLILALDNDVDGIFIDAVLLSEAEAHNIFSSTLANFHVTNTRYHELAAFLHSIMPARALGLHYSTIGFNHIGKVAVMGELRDELTAHNEVLDTALGFRGSVAIGFSAPSSRYVLKVVRDKPTDQYKWGKFPGIADVLGKYRRVHEINRTDSMLDNMIYQRIDLDANWFGDDVLDELLSAASENVNRQGDRITFRHLIVQPKLMPLNLYLRSASPDDAEAAIINLGHCIKNNASANIFNRDLDARNYGVSRYGKVHLFDYDAVEVLGDIKIRTNLDRFDGEEDIPDWFFEDGYILLPEEIDAGLGLEDRDHLRAFRTHHGDLLTPRYWQAMQSRLRAGDVPRISIYPEAARLER
ncbi:MAG: bifunctional isocitrate dehydrogenase kinase/phosphatase [Rhizobiales bacterium]|nr:bifunctional isocitrate dehydrogenase kinase/phosphatase [Hyphomicrobiales bacterium]